MDYPFNDEIFDHDNEEIFQNNQLETESLWCNSLIDISEYDNQFFHEESEFPDFLTTNSNTLIQSHEINPFSLDITEENNNNAIDLQLSPAQLKPESTFDSKLYDSIQKQNAKSVSNICKQKSKSQPFIIDNLSQSKNITFVATESVDHPSSDSTDFINSVNDLKFPSTILTLNPIDEHSPDDFSRKNVFYLDQYNSFNRKSKPTIFLAKRNPITNYRKSISKLRKTENSSLYSMYQDPGNRSQAQRVTYSLSPSTSSPDSAVDFSLSVSGPQKPYNDDSSIFSGHNDPPNRFYEMKYKVDKTARENLYASKISSSRLFQSPIPQTGILILTEEEKRTMMMENYSIPTRLPLTKQEERNLKKVRRKIKNKISAQESRRKKKEYMEALEKKVEIYAHENNDLKKRLENQESLNKSLLGQLRHLQQMLGRAGSNTASTCLMVFLLCFSLILVGMPNRLQTMTPPQSVLVVSNIHKMGYGSIKSIQRSQMTAMQRYFPPDINVLLENTKTKIMFLSNNESLFAKDNDRGNEPIESIFNVNDVLITVSDQRKGILLENTKDEEEDCIQYGPKYLWWLHQFTNQNPVEDPVTSTPSVSIANYSESGTNSSATKESEGILFNSLIGTSNISEPNIENNWYNSTDDHFKLSFFSLST